MKAFPVRLEQLAQFKRAWLRAVMRQHKRRGHGGPKSEREAAAREALMRNLP